MNSVLDRFIRPENPPAVAAVAAVATDERGTRAPCTTPEVRECRALAPADLALANALLDHYGETDPVTRAEYLDRLASSHRLLAQCHAAAVAAGIATWDVAA